MTRIAPLFLALLAAPELTGYVSHYAPGVFEGVVAHRWANDWWRNEPPADWHEVAGYAATTDCDQVGRVMWMRPEGAAEWQRVLVADCAGDQATIDWMLANRIVAELDHALFTNWSDQYGVPLKIQMRPEPRRNVIKGMKQ